MGSVYTIEVPSGHQLKVEADSPEEALSTANAWKPSEASSAPVTGYGSMAAAAGGLGRGTAMLGGLPGDLGDFLNKGINKGLSAVGISPAPLAPNTFGSENIQKQMEKVTGEFHKPQNTVEKYIDTAASFVPAFVPAAVAAPGGAVSNAIRYGIFPGLASEAAGQATIGKPIEPYARAAAGIVAGTINPARAITPYPVSDARIAALNALKKEGVTSLTAGQKTGNLGLRNLEEAVSSAPLAGNRAAEMQGLGQQQFTEAATRRAGMQGLATPENLAANQDRLGQAFNDLSSRNTLISDHKMVNDIVDAVSKYKNVPPSFERSQIETVINDIMPHVQAGQMPGTQYQALRHYLTKEAHSTNDSYFGNALAGIRDALDNAMSRSVSPEDAALWKQIRKEYGAQEVIKKAASRAGEATAEGQITPSNLRNIVSSENRGAYALGRGPFSELAHAGESVMRPLPNSGTAQKLNAYRILDSLMFGLPQAAAGRVLMNPVTQEILANQLMRRSLPKSSEAQKLLMIQALQRSQNAQ